MSGASILRLRDGRRLAYRALGPADGTLVLYLHGAIGSPHAACPRLESIVEELDLRYVVVSRPGFDGSDRADGRTLPSFAGDAAQLADALGCPRFAVVGVSAGGPYALALAHMLPQRVRIAAVVSCMAPGHRPPTGLPAPARLGLRLLRACPRGCSRAGDALLALARRNPRLVARVMYAGAARDDRRLLDEPDARTAATQRFLAAARGGVGGMVEDYLLCTSPWGFSPAAVAPLVQLWHGALDTLVPADEAVGLAAALPRAQLALHPDEGHFFYGRRLREILGSLAEALAPSASRSVTSVDQPNPRAPSPCPDPGW